MNCQCTSIRCPDYRRRILGEAADRIVERPVAITNRREASQFLYWVSGQIVTALDQVAAAADEEE
jgi:hypothetical protein